MMCAAPLRLRIYQTTSIKLFRRIKCEGLMSLKKRNPFEIVHQCLPEICSTPDIWNGDIWLAISMKSVELSNFIT